MDHLHAVYHFNLDPLNYDLIARLLKCSVPSKSAWGWIDDQIETRVRKLFDAIIAFSLMGISGLFDLSELDLRIDHLCLLDLN